MIKGSKSMTIGNIQIKNKYLWMALIIVVVVILIGVINWIANTSIIEVEVKNPQDGYEITNTFTNQIDKKVTTNNSKATSIQQLLPSSTYESLTEQNFQSFFTISETEGFLNNTFVEAILKNENKRDFVGNNPQDCMHYVNEVLVTLKCGDLLANASVHVAATPTLPTFVTTTRGQGPAGFDEGVFQTKDGSFSLSQTPNSSENGQTHILNKLGDNFKSTQVVIITNNNLNRSTKYKSNPYKTGFIAYNSNFTEVMYFPGFSNKAENIANSNPQNVNNPISLDVKNETILTSYKGNENSLVYLNTNGALEAFTVNKAYSQIMFCGEKYFCMINDGQLDIYELVNNRFIFQFSIVDVKAVHQTSTALLVINNYGVLNLNIPQKSGYLAYSFGEYKFNSSAKTTNNNSIIINLTNPSRDRVALLINPLAENSDNIDKKVINIENDKNIKTFSIYKNYITIVPDIPKDANTKNNTFDTSRVESINQQITKYLQDSGINLREYKINFTVR